MPAYFANRRGLRSGSAGGGGESGPDTFATIFGSDLHAWYDASDAASITEAAGAVSQWNDKSGNAFHLAQGTGAKQPAYSATGLGSAQPAITFDGSGDELQTTTDAFTFPAATSEFAAFLVGRLLVGANGYAGGVVFNVGGSDVGATAGILLTRANAAEAIGAYRNGDKGLKAITHNTTVRVASVWDDANHTLYLSNVAGTTVADANGALATAGTLFVGGRGGGNYWAGPICEIAIVKRAPTAGELTSVDALLAAKWTA
jgi:hypothetical protein